MRSVILLIAAFAVCIGCSTPSVLLKKNTQISQLGIYFESGDHAAPLISKYFEHTVDSFIKVHNANPSKKFVVYKSTRPDSCSLRIKLVTTQLVNSSQQTTGVVVSTLGLSLPFIMIAGGAPIFLGFYYFPQAKSLTEFALSSDLDGFTPQRSRSEFILSSPGFLKSPEKQIEKHVIYFDRFLRHTVSQIEKQVKKGVS